MAHPTRFETDDPLLARVREVCLALPGAGEKVSHGRPNFFTKKVFAVYGGVVKGDHHSGRYDRSLLFVPDPAEAAALRSDSRFFVPAYLGPSGWLGLDLETDAVDWAELGELVEDSFRLTAPARLVAQLDRGRNEHLP